MHQISQISEFWDIFSLPEHKVLMVSYCDRALSIVRRAPSVVRKHLSSTEQEVLRELL